MSFGSNVKICGLLSGIAKGKSHSNFTKASKKFIYYIQVYMYTLLFHYIYISIV